MDHNNEMEIHMNLLLVEDDLNLGKILKNIKKTIGSPRYRSYSVPYRQTGN